MEDTDALHTAARAHVIERHRHWVDRYTELQEGREFQFSTIYSDEDLDTFPRYNVLKAILAEIERSVPGDLGSLEEARERHVAAARSGESPTTRISLTRPEPDGSGLIARAIAALRSRTPSGRHELDQRSTEERAMAEEREDVVAYVGGLGPEDLASVEELPYRRTLDDAEGQELRRRLVTAWGIDPTAYAHGEVAIDRSDVEEFRDDRFFEEGIGEHLRRALLGRGITSVLTLHTYFPYQRELDLAWVDWDVEAFWFDREFGWVVGTGGDEEDNVAVGGWLLDELRLSWPTWREAVR